MSTDERQSEEHTSDHREIELIYPRSGSKILVDEEPTGRSGHSMVSDESDLYIFGGYNPLGRVLNQGRPTVLEEVWKFNFAMKKWTKMGTAGFPSTCASSCLLIRGTKLYVYGGTSYPFGQKVSNTIKVCDIAKPYKNVLSNKETDREDIYHWHNLEPIQQDITEEDENKPPKGYGQSVIFYDHYIYIFGGAVGFYNEAIGDLHRLNLDTMAWEKLTPTGDAPEGRYKQEVIRDAHCFYVMGGGRLHSAQSVHIMYRYSFADNTWTKLTSLPDPTFGHPKPRSAFALVQVDRDVYICGGSSYGVNNQPHQVLQDIWHLSLNTFRWTQLRVSLPECMYFHRAAVSPSHHLYVYGGVVSGGKRSNKLYCYRLPFQLAMLKELCWAKVYQLWKNMKDADPMDLTETYGIPQEFVERLA